MNIVAKLALGYGPGCGVVSLEGSDNVTQNGSPAVAVVVDGPVEDAASSVCEDPGCEGNCKDLKTAKQTAPDTYDGLDARERDQQLGDEGRRYHGHLVILGFQIIPLNVHLSHLACIEKRKG